MLEKSQVKAIQGFCLVVTGISAIGFLTSPAQATAFIGAKNHEFYRS